MAKSVPEWTICSVLEEVETSTKGEDKHSEYKPLSAATGPGHRIHYC